MDVFDFCLLVPISLNSFQILLGLLLFSLIIAEYSDYLDFLKRFASLFRQLLYSISSFRDLYLSLVFIALIFSGVNHFGCCLCLTRKVFKGRCLSTISMDIDDQEFKVSSVSSKILIISHGAD